MNRTDAFRVLHEYSTDVELQTVFNQPQALEACTILWPPFDSRCWAKRTVGSFVRFLWTHVALVKRRGRYLIAEKQGQVLYEAQACGHGPLLLRAWAMAHGVLLLEGSDETPLGLAN